MDDHRRSQSIDIVIPVYNEKENILSTLKAFEREVHSPVRILICYDHDEDTTLKVLQSYQGHLPIIPVKNRGKFAHGAVTSGFRFSDAPAVIAYMADDDYNARMIDPMIEAFGQGAEVVCPSRFIPGGKMVGCRWQKAALVRIAAFGLHIFGRLPAHDPTNGFRLFSRRLLDRTSIESTEGFTYSIELLAKCHRLGWKIVELPAQWFERSHGSSRFQVFRWAPAYLRWVSYIFATTYLGRKTVMPGRKPDSPVLR